MTVDKKCGEHKENDLQLVQLLNMTAMGVAVSWCGLAPGSVDELASLSSGGAI